MPTYEYTCSDCGTHLEVFQKFSEKALTICPECNGHLRKVFSPVGVVFKGSGFYATDNRTKGKTAASIPAGTHHDQEPTSATASSDSGSAGSGSSEKTGTTTAAASPAPEAKVA